MKKIAIHGVPRSGTSWVGAIFDSSPNVEYRYQPLFSYKFKSFLTETSTKDEIDNFFELILNTEDDFILQKEEKETGSKPTFSKNHITHIAYKEVRYHNILDNLLNKDREINVIGIIRNPKSVISSWYHAPKEFDKDKWNLLDEWENAFRKNEGKPEEFFGYNKWKEVAALFLDLKEKYPENFYLLKYQNLLTDIVSETQRLFDFCEIDISTQTIEFISKSQNIDMSNDAYSVYRKNHSENKWDQTLPEQIINTINSDLSNSRLEQFN